MRPCAAVVCLLLLVCVCAMAQDAPKAGANQAPPLAQPAPPPSAQPTDKPGDKAADKPAGKPGDKPGDKPADKPADKAVAPAAKVEEPPPPPPEEPTGDVITLKSGKVLNKVQVISRSPSAIEVDVGNGITMSIPRKQIADIKYDKVEPSKRKAGSDEQGSAKTADIIQGSKITAEVSAKLTAPIPAPPLKYENQDLVVIMEELSKRLGITIIVDDPVKALPDKDRQWSFESAPEMTLMALLQDNLLKSFANLGVVYQYDKLLVTTKEAADAIAVKEAQSEEKAEAPAKPAEEKPAAENPAAEKAAPGKPADEKPAPEKAAVDKSKPEPAKP